MSLIRRIFFKFNALWFAALICGGLISIHLPHCLFECEDLDVTFSLVYAHHEPGRSINNCFEESPVHDFVYLVGFQVVKTSLSITQFFSSPDSIIGIASLQLMDDAVLIREMAWCGVAVLSDHFSSGLTRAPPAAVV